jgi:protein tyrosine phosphatase (PTP) superfamily phosphohydrolase (DUF442 family)
MRTVQALLLSSLLSACGRSEPLPSATAASSLKTNAPARTYRAGEDSLAFHIAVDDGERRGEPPGTQPTELKKDCWRLLESLRGDGKGLKAETELNIESFFTVADAFEADGLLQQSVDYLGDLKHKLEDLAAARAGRANPKSLIATEEDILHFRDSHNIHVMDGKYSAGAQPTEKGYRWLKSKGVTAIVNLRVPKDHEKQLVESLGMKYIHIPWADEHAPSIEQAQAMLKAVEESEGKVFQHCLRGIGRDMTMASVYMIAKHGSKADECIQHGRDEAPRWEADQKRDPTSGEPVQFKMVRDFERTWLAREHKANPGTASP